MIEWECPKCGLVNDAAEEKCEDCGYHQLLDLDLDDLRRSKKS